MNEQKQSGDLKSILSMINRAAETFAFEVYIPSLCRNVMFREITTSQQKRLIKAIIDSPAYQTEFIFAFYQIIKENCTEDLDLAKLTILDKLSIALSLRCMSIGTSLDLKFTFPATKKQDTIIPEHDIVRRINLKDLLDIILKDIKVEPITIKDDRGVFEVFCDLPTIQEEFNLENEMHKNNSIEIKSESELRETVGDVFINIIVKYIKNIKIKENDKIIEIDLKSLSFKERLAILGQIPTKVSKQVVEYINKVTKEFDKVVLFKAEENGTEIEQRLKIDSSFFTPS